MSSATDIHEDKRTYGDLGAVKMMLRTLYGTERNELAERLFVRFGSLRGIFDATIAELVETGLTERAADFFAFVSPFVRAARLRSAPARLRFSEASAAEFASRFFEDIGKTGDYLFIAGDDGSVPYTEKIDGEPVRSVIGIACRQAASDVMWMRYRPRETIVEPDRMRIEQAVTVAKALDSVGIRFIDYIEYGAGENYSLRREAYKYASGAATDPAELYAPDKDYIAKLENYVAAKR